MRYIALALLVLLPTTGFAETRNYVKGATVQMNGDQMAANLDSALGFTGTTVRVGITPTLVIVSHPSLTSANDAAVNAAIAAYVFDALYDQRAPAKNIIGAASDQASLVLRATASVLLDEVNAIRASYPLPVVSITRSGTTATVTTRWAHGLSNGASVTIHGADVAAYNGAFTIAGASGTTFTYQVAGSPTTPAAGSLLAFPVTAAPAPRTMNQAVTAIQGKITSGSAD